MKSFTDLAELADILLGEKGCPWDRKQTIFSLEKHLLEEAYEVIEAIDLEDYDHIKEELGDLLYTIIFISKVCEKKGKFTLNEMIDDLHKKFVRRHPHIFGEEKAQTSDDVLKVWDRVKIEEKKPQKSAYPKAMPLLLQTQKIVKKLIKQKKLEDIEKEKTGTEEEEIANKIFKLIIESEKREITAEDALRRYIKFILQKYDL